MPLTKSTVTAASRVMLPTYVAFFAGVGLSFTLTPADRLRQTPGLEYAHRVADLALWGAGFLLVAAILGAGLLLRHRSTYRAGLSVACLWMAAWALVLALAAFNGDTSFSAWTWPAFVAIACWASLVSLAAREA